MTCPKPLLRALTVGALLFGALPAPAQWIDWFTVTNSGNRINTGTDFFASVVNDTLDYANLEDRRFSGFEDLNLTGTVQSGVYGLTSTTDDPNIWLWHPGIRGAYADEGTGAFQPINADVYRILTIKMTCDNCPTPVGGNFVGANIFWYKGPAASEFATTTAAFAVFPATHIYQIDLGALSGNQLVALPTASGVNGLWSGTVQGLRFDPANRTGITMSIDWVTLSAPSTSSATINWGSFSGSAKVRLLPDNSGSPGSPHMAFQRTLCVDGPSCASSFTQFSMVSQKVGDTSEAPMSVSTLTSINTTGLGPGTYWLQAVDVVNNPITGTTPQKIVVNTYPQIFVLQPDSRGDESSNYPLLYRNNADVWDFSQDNDFEFSFSQNLLEYGNMELATNPSTACGGATVTGRTCAPATLSGNWLKHDNSLATLTRNDSQFFPRLGGAPLDSTRYRHVTMRVLLDRARDIGDLGAVSRLIWFKNKPLATGEIEQLNISEDIFVQNGVQELHVDLRRIRVDPGSNGKNAWEQSGFIKYFRVDPHEYTTNTLAYYDEIMLATNDKTSSGQFTIRWNNTGRTPLGVEPANGATDSDGDAISITRIALDPDSCGRAGNLGQTNPVTGGQNGPIGVICPDPSNANEITIATNPPNTGSFLFDAAGLSAASLPSGTYYVRIEFTDGRNSAVRYSNAPLDVNRLPTAAKVPMFRLYSKASDYHFFTISQGNKDFAISAGFQDESNPVPFYVWNVPQSGSVPMFRMYNPNRGVHFYTATASDLPFLRPLGALHEGEEGNIFPLGSGSDPCTAVSGSVELFRLYNNNSGLHLYTADPSAKNGILALFAGIWVQHASLGCAFNSP